MVEAGTPLRALDRKHHRVLQLFPARTALIQVVQVVCKKELYDEARVSVVMGDVLGGLLDSILVEHLDHNLAGNHPLRRSQVQKLKGIG